MRKLQLTVLLLVLTFILSPFYGPNVAFPEELQSDASPHEAQGTPQPELTPLPDVKTYTPAPQKEEPTHLEMQDESLITAHATNPTALKAIERNIVLFTERIRERFTTYLQRSGKYLDLMRDILRSKKIPEDIAFLPLIESGFNPNAYSVARAVGPWQFIADTAKRYGLKIDWWKDERKDPVKSTVAAADYLKDLYEMFGSWNLAMAAYNAGEGKILKALNRSQSGDYWELVDTEHIKDETKEYVPRFIAAGLIATSPGEYGFDDLTYLAPFKFDEVVLDSPVDLDVAARCAGTSVRVIRDLNPELRRWCTPANARTYTLRIPAGKGETFFANLSMIPKQNRFSIDTYTVKKKDTLKKISVRTGIPVNVILELNNTGIRSLKQGEVLYLPPREKFSLDRDDRVLLKKASCKVITKEKPSSKKKSKGKMQRKRVLVASVGKKGAYLHN
jgi:peptidoglycan lytic transglycosylase D